MKSGSVHVGDEELAFRDTQAPYVNLVSSRAGEASARGTQLWGSEETAPAGDWGLGEGGVLKKTQGQIRQLWQPYTLVPHPRVPGVTLGWSGCGAHVCACDTRFLNSLQVPLLF